MPLVMCPKCNGAREVYDKSIQDWIECDRCHGSGTIFTKERS